VGWNNLHDEAHHDYEVTGQTWQGLRQWYIYSGEREENMQKSIDSLDGIYLTLEFDGHQTMSQPLGSFFGVALGKFGVRNLFLSVDNLVADGAFTSWFPMPFSRSFKLLLSRVMTLLEPAPPVEETASVRWQ
jgi:hypothetical protein